MTITRAAWGDMFDHCMVCGKRKPRLQTHEICRGVHRAKALKEPAAWIRTCPDCHRDKLDGMSIVRQLAIKKICDPVFYSRRTVNTLRCRAEESITEAEVDAVVKTILEEKK